MSKYSIAQIEAIDRERRCREKELNSALCLKRFTSQDRLVPELDTVVYRLEFPKMRDVEDMLKLFHRVAGMMAYHIRKLGNENEMIAIIGYSEHKAWTPYAKVYGKKGGRGKKVFMHAEATKRVPHIYIDMYQVFWTAVISIYEISCKNRGQRRVLITKHNSFLCYT